MTQVTLASKDSTPQVHGPFHVVLADLPAFTAFAGAPAAFTPADGDVLLTAWCKPTVTVVEGAGGSTLQVQRANGDGFAMTPGTSPARLLDSANGFVSVGEAVKLTYSAGADPFVSGEVDVFVLVLPSAS